MKTNRTATPTAYTAADIARMNAAIAAHDAHIARRARGDRLCALIVCAVSVFLAVSLFYSF